MLCDVGGRGTCQQAFFFPIYGFERHSEKGFVSGFDFYEGQNTVVVGHEIYFEAFVAPVSRQDPVTVDLEGFFDKIFSAAAFHQVFCHSRIVFGCYFRVAICALLFQDDRTQFFPD